MSVDPSGKLSWRWPAAVTLFMLAFVGLMSGVSLTERPSVVDADALTRAYYCLGLFVVGGLDLGTPVDGPVYGRMMLWIAYFGAPVFTASAVIEALMRVISPGAWQFRRLRRHVVIVGSGPLTSSYLRVLRQHDPNVQVVVVDHEIETVLEQELAQTFGVNVVVGDIGHRFLLDQLRLHRARRVVLLGNNDFEAYEAVHQIVELFPRLKSRIVLHSHNLRFLRTMQTTGVDQYCESFNSYHLAAAGLVRDWLLGHIRETEGKDVVVMAGFGRFGQAILEELENQAEHDIDTVAVIDLDANRRILVAEEQQRLGHYYRREVFQGDISHPEVWRQLRQTVNLDEHHPTIILGTGRTEDNLRTALWLADKHPNARVYARTNDASPLAIDIARENGFHTTSITELLEDNIPAAWLD